MSIWNAETLARVSNEAPEVFAYGPYYYGSKGDIEFSTRAELGTAFSVA